MLTKLSGGTVYDPAQEWNGVRRDLYIRDGRMVADPGPEAKVDQEFDLRGKVVMAGAIDLHTHIGGGKVNIARAMLPEDHRDEVEARTEILRSGTGRAVPSSWTTGYRYAQMGYTAAFEPAMVPVNARQAHLEMADTPMIDTGAYAMLGSDDLLLRLLAEGADQAVINDYVAWTLQATQALGIKVVNPGGINAFKFNQRSMDLDEENRHYRITPRKILGSLTRALHELGVPHPLHVHGCNLGVPGNFATTLDTMGAAEGLPMHLTHIQFHSYGQEGDRKFSSAAVGIAEAVNRHRNISVDVGQVMFGQTVTLSGDTMHQYANRHHAHPHKWMCMDIECEAGCGIVPFRYRDQNFVNALQWAIGLELFLLVDDPWRIFLTTDHPNGAVFTSYPHLIKLLMNRGYRNALLEQIHPDAAAHSELHGIKRELSLYEIAIMTRAGPARILGLRDHGHLGPGALGDVVVYEAHEDQERMFAAPAYVFRRGELVVRDGQMVKVVNGATQAVHPEFDRGIEKRVGDYFDRYHSMHVRNFAVRESELSADGQRSLVLQPTRSRGRA